MSDDKIDQVLMENVQLIYRNFEGKEGMYNKKGDRNFSVILPPDVAEQMEKDGWNVKYLKAREEGDEEVAYLPVAVNFSNRPPRIVMITSRARTNVDESMAEVLDYADIKVADLIVNPYTWSVNGKSGIKAYLKSLFITIEEDELERKYAVNQGE
jgi:hypothetical protein